MQIEDYLYQKKLYQPLSGHQPENMKDEDWILLDRQALGVIQLTLSRNVAFNIAKENTTVGLMTTLSSMYEKSSTSNKVHLMRRLFNLRMSDGVMVAQHLNELNIITIQLSSVGIEFDDDVRALILLSSLPEMKRFDGKSQENLQPLQFCMQSQEEEVRTEDMDVEDPRKEGTILRITAVSKTQRQLNVGIVESARKNHEDKAEANVASTSGGEDALICSLGNKEEPWVLDSGASFHATSQKEFFENYVPGNLGKVYLGNEQSCEMLNGSVWELKNIRHILDLTKNLISVGQLANNGYTTVFHGDNWKISKGAMTIARGRKSGHISEKGMRIMHSKGKLPSLRSIEFDMREDCILGKQKRVSFQRSRRIPKKERLKLVHSNVWGPRTISSIGDKRYFVTFIDDHSRKSEVFEVFKFCKAMVENETGLNIKKFRSDNGEYEDTRFKKFCYEQGIIMERNVPGTPQHNGVAECMNRTLTKAVLGRSSQHNNLLNQLRFVGSIGAQNTRRGRNKLDPKSKKCTFIGYGEDEFGYRFWDNENQKMIRSRDVIFNEKVMYKDRNNTCNNNSEQSRPVYVEMDYVPETPVIETPQSKESCENNDNENLTHQNFLFQLLFEKVFSASWEPENYEEACQMTEASKWELAMKDEMKSLMSNQTWELVELPDHDGSKIYKARLVVKGFQQKEGVNYTEIFAPVVHLNTIRYVLSIVASEGLYLEQLDVKIGFLHGDLDEEIYMHQPKGDNNAVKTAQAGRQESKLGAKVAERIQAGRHRMGLGATEWGWAPESGAGRENLLEKSLGARNPSWARISADMSKWTSPPTLHSSPREIRKGPWRLFGGVGKLSHSSLGLQASSMEEDGSQIGDGDAKGRRKWSMEQLPRTLGKALHLLFGSNFFPISSICRTLSSPPWRAFPICGD
ncbi:hypothetical protein V8G54_018210 [Vigna mungo]|uniref:Integrase catalytic domain-containing protein n=1 Tax=Vigna mungo TaxID=3915 RepID=A0AAQ3RUD2_VIGMU